VRQYVKAWNLERGRRARKSKLGSAVFDTVRAGKGRDRRASARVLEADEVEPEEGKAQEGSGRVVV